MSCHVTWVVAMYAIWAEVVSVAMGKADVALLERQWARRWIEAQMAIAAVVAD